MASGTTIPMLVDMRPNWSLFGFAAAASLIAAMIFGLAPGLAGTYVEPAAALKAAAGLTGGGAQSRSHRGRVGRLLVAAETTLALVLLVGAGLLLRTLINLKTLDPGFRRDHLLTVGLFFWATLRRSWSRWTDVLLTVKSET